VDVRIGVTYSPRELDIELAPDIDREALKQRVEAALAEDDERAVLWLTDSHGREFAVPAAKIAYVEIGSPDHERRIGFAAG
jgi:hypothetical protein